MSVHTSKKGGSKISALEVQQKLQQVSGLAKGLQAAVKAGNASKIQAQMPLMFKQVGANYNCAIPCMAKKCKWRKSVEVFYIDELPYTVKKSGKYKVREGLLNYSTKKDPCGGTAAISIIATEKFTGGVYLDMNGAAIDMNGDAGTTILLQGVNNITIVNGTIRNSGLPQPKNGNQYAIPPASLAGLNVADTATITDTTLGQQQANLDFMMANNPTFPNTSIQSYFTYPAALDPTDGVGISFNDCTGVIIENMIFQNMFFGVFGYSNTPDASDASFDIFVNNCFGIECGGDFTGLEPPTPVAVPPTFGPQNQPFRGGFVGFSGTSFIGPTTAAPFYNTPYATGPFTAFPDMPPCFGRGSITNCVALSNASLGLVFMNYCRDWTVENCFMCQDAFNITPNTWDLVAPFLGYFNSHINFRNCVSLGGMDSWRFMFNYSTVFDSCIGVYHYNTAFSTYFNQNTTRRQCIGSEALNYGFQDAQVTNYGFEMISETYGILIDSICSNYRTAEGNNVDGVGVDLVGSHCLVKNNHIMQNHLGLLLAISDHCIIDGNDIYSNGVDIWPGGAYFGWINSGVFFESSSSSPIFPTPGGPGGLDSWRGCQFVRNYFHNNGNNGSTHIFNISSLPQLNPNDPTELTGELPYLVTAPFNGLQAIAPYANIQTTPSIYNILGTYYPFIYPPSPSFGGIYPAMAQGVNLAGLGQAFIPILTFLQNGFGLSGVTIVSMTLYQANGTYQSLTPSDPTFPVFLIGTSGMTFYDDGWYFVSVTYSNGSTYYSNLQSITVLGIQTLLSNAVGNGTTVTYTIDPSALPNPYSVGDFVLINGIYNSDSSISGLNITNAQIISVTANTFTVANTTTDTWPTSPPAGFPVPAAFQQRAPGTLGPFPNTTVILPDQFPPRSLITALYSPISGFPTNSGNPGDTLFISGMNFTNVAYVQFGSTQVPLSQIQIYSSDLLLVTVPSGPSGTVDVTVWTTGTSPDPTTSPPYTGSSYIVAADQFTYL